MRKFYLSGIIVLLVALTGCNTKDVLPTPTSPAFFTEPSNATPTTSSVDIRKILNDLSKISNTDLKLKSSMIIKEDIVFYIDKYDKIVKENRSTGEPEIVRDIYGNDYYVYQIFLDDRNNIYYCRGNFQTDYYEHSLYLLNDEYDELGENDELIADRIFYVIYTADNYIFYLDIDGVIHIYDIEKKVTSELYNTQMKMTPVYISNSDPYVLLTDDLSHNNGPLYLYNIMDNSLTKIIDDTRKFLITDDGKYILSWNQDKSSFYLQAINRDANGESILLQGFTLSEYHWVISAFVDGNDIFILTQDEDIIAIDIFDFASSKKENHISIENIYLATDTIYISSYYWAFYYNDIVEGTYNNPETIRLTVAVFDIKSRKIYEKIVLKESDTDILYECILLELTDKELWLTFCQELGPDLYNHFTRIDISKYLE